MTAVTVEELVAVILPRLGRVQGGGDNISARCPFDDHEDREASFSLNRLTGLWKCHGRCGRKGNAYQLAKHLGCLPRASSRTRLSHAPNVDWGLDAAMKRYDVKVTPKATVFAITDHEGNACRRHARYHEGTPRFQFWDKNTGRQTYHAWLSWDLLREWGAGCGVAYVLEGNRDALVSAAHGYPSIGVLGTKHFKDAWRDIVGPLRQMGVGAIVVTPQNDEPGLMAAAEWVSAIEADGFVVGLRILPDTIAGKAVKDVFDVYDADRDGFGDLMHELPVVYR